MKQQATNAVSAPTGMGFDVLEPTQVTFDGGLAPIDDLPVHVLPQQPATRPVRIPAMRQPPQQLPQDIPHFVGRADIMRQLDDLLAAPDDQSAIVSLDGGPGVGKTAVATRWARNSLTRFDDGVLYADLNGYGHGTPTSPATVLTTFLEALGIPHDYMPRDIGSERPCCAAN